jgi:hypothetical protein
MAAGLSAEQHQVRTPENPEDEGSMSAVRERLGSLCGQITQHADMEGEIRDAGAGRQLDEVLTAVRAGDTLDPKKLIALLNEIEEACSSRGLAGVTTKSRNYEVLPPGFDAAPKEEPSTWICPSGRCARTVFDEESAAPPLCAAGGGVTMTATRVFE